MKQPFELLLSTPLPSTPLPSTPLPSTPLRHRKPTFWILAYLHMISLWVDTSLFPEIT